MNCDYIDLTRSFWKKHELAPFTGNQTLLYWRLVDLFNGQGQGKAWPDELRFMDDAVCSKTGMSINTMKPCRITLEERGLIEFESTGKGFRSGGLYRLTSTERSSKRTSKRSSNSDELPKRTSNSDDLLGKDSQEDSQIDHQKDHQKLTFSYIYIESKQNKQPNYQTVNNTMLVANRDEGGLEKRFRTSLIEKRKKSPPKLRPPPPSSRPTGQSE